MSILGLSLVELCLGAQGGEACCTPGEKSRPEAGSHLGVSPHILGSSQLGGRAWRCALPPSKGPSPTALLKRGQV